MTLNAELIQAYEKDEIFDPHFEENVIPVVLTAPEASRSVSSVRRIREKKTELKAIRDTEIARIDSWYRQQVEILDRNLNWFEVSLKTFLGIMRKSDPKYTLRTPHGVVSLKKAGEEWKYPEDESAFIAFLEAQELPFVRVKKEIDRKAIREGCTSTVITCEGGSEVRTVCTADGMVLEGVTVEITPETLVYRFPKGDGAGE